MCDTYSQTVFAESNHAFIQHIQEEIKDFSIDEMNELFSNEYDILSWLENIRWSNNICCPYCSGTQAWINRQAKLRSYICKTCKKYFSIRTNTPMQKSQSSLVFWVFSIYFLTTSSHEFAVEQLNTILGVRKREAQGIIDRLECLSIIDSNICQNTKENKEQIQIVNETYHIVQPKYIVPYNKELTALGLRRLTPDAKTLCNQLANNINLIASDGIIKCSECKHYEDNFAMTVNSRLRYKQFYLQEENNGAFVYLDLSNIYIGAQSTSIKYDENAVYGDTRLNYPNMLRMLQSIDNIKDITVVGTHIRSIDKFLNRVEETEHISTHVIKNEIIEEKERFADENLQIKMLHDMLDYKPSTAIIMTGDGNGANNNVGFFEEIIRMHGLGWEIALLSWSNSCHQSMKHWVDQNGTYINLDKYYKYITEQRSDIKNYRKALDFVA